MKNIPTHFKMLNKKLPKHSGIYKIKDNIDNLTIEIKLYSVDSIKQLPKYEIQTTTTKRRTATAKASNVEWHFNVIGENGQTGKESENKLIESALFKWQEKRFSAREIELFSHSENCLTDVQKKYHAYIQKRIKKCSSRKSKTAQLNTRRKNDLKSSLACKIFTYTQEDDYQLYKFPNDNNIDNSNKESSSSKVMFIYADIHPDVLLAKLEWFADSRILRIFPDFQTDSLSDPYNIEIITGSYHLYSYTMNNVSPLQELQFPRGYNLFKSSLHNLKSQIQPYLKVEEREHKFSVPAKRKNRCCILLEIQEICGFARHNIYIRYRVNLPQGCTLEDGLVEGSTHLATQTGHYASNIGFCYQFTVLCDEMKYESNEHFYILFEVISIDYWGRQCTEGSCFLHINLLKPSHGCERLQCIKPVENFWNTINRYLLGGSRNFIWNFFPNNYTARQNDAKIVKFHCLYGEKLENVGELQLKYESFVQRNFDFLPISGSRNHAMILDDIIMAYKVARQKLDSTAIN